MATLHCSTTIKEYNMLKKIWNRIVEMQEARAAYFPLQNMTDKELHDIGVTRGELKQRIYS